MPYTLSMIAPLSIPDTSPRTESVQYNNSSIVVPAYPVKPSRYVLIHTISLLPIFSAFLTPAAAQLVQPNNQGIIINTVVVPAYSTQSGDADALRQVLEDQRNHAYPTYELPSRTTPTVDIPHRSDELDTSMSGMGYRKTRTAVVLRTRASSKSASILVLPANSVVVVDPFAVSDKRYAPQTVWAPLKYYDQQAREYREGFVQWKFLKATSIFDKTTN